MTEIANDKGITWKWLVGVLLFLVFAASGIIIADTRTGVERARNAIEQIQKEKVDKEQYHRDIGEIKEILKSIGEKIDRIKSNRK